MKCRFCGKRIKKNSSVCSKCGREVTEGITTDDLIDALPELHDEFDNISKIQAKEKRKKEKKQKRSQYGVRRIVIAICVAIVILAGVFASMLYYKNKQVELRKAQEEAIILPSAVEAVVQKMFVGGGFSDMVVVDETSAKEVIKAQKGIFSFVDASQEFALSKQIKSGSNTIYRFQQKYQGVPVYGGEMVIMTDAFGKVLCLNGVYVPTKGLTTLYKITDANASLAISEYVNSLEDFALVSGISISEIEKTVLNTDNKSYLAYRANVSGYNDKATYLAYDVFVDGVNGDGICVSVTSSYENGTDITEGEVEKSYIYEMATASDKFKWNDETNSIAREKILIQDIENGNASAYVTDVKNAVDTAYNYFEDAFSWKGLSGDGKSFMVYINPNEYVEKDLPTEKALYTNDKLMFFREDLTQGGIDYNTVVHEYTHGVLYNLVGFRGTMDYTENSAIAEGLADTFSELAEASANASSPDWLHKERNLSAPIEGYLSHIPDSVKIESVEDCYRHSTIVSSLASKLYEALPDLSVQNELWFKAAALMTKSTDFNELESILNTVVLSMHNEQKIDSNAFSTMIEHIKNLGSKQITQN